jgi:hypothetical protein
MIATDWDPAPDDQVLFPGQCPARDADGQGCTHGRVHRGRHQSTGLRRWLEQGSGEAFIRAYDAAQADRLEAMEAPLFARFGFVPFARQELVRQEVGGIDWDWARFRGVLLAPNKKFRISLRLVCFARRSSPATA